jgi:hypothetical protein
MRRRHFPRLTVALIAILSLLFSQLAMANYACPQQVGVVSMAVMMEGGMPCDGMDRQQPPLCHQHAADPGQAFEVVKLPAASPPVVVQVMQLPLVREPVGTRAVPAAAAPEGRSPPDPLFLSTLRLRV